MKQGGFLVRFIDIGLIILFGFLIISDIDFISQIQMPGSDEAKTSTLEQETVYVYAEIGPGGRYAVKEEQPLRWHCRDVRRLAELETCLVDVRERYLQEGKNAVVLLRPHDDSIVQQLVSVRDICERHNIIFNIEAEELRL